jgi:hypothetical protein
MVINITTNSNVIMRVIANDIQLITVTMTMDTIEQAVVAVQDTDVTLLPRSVTIDEAQVEAWTNRVVALTEGYSIDALDRMRISLHSTIKAYRQQWDRSQLITVSYRYQYMNSNINIVFLPRILIMLWIHLRKKRVFLIVISNKKAIHNQYRKNTHTQRKTRHTLLSLNYNDTALIN